MFDNLPLPIVDILEQLKYIKDNTSWYLDTNNNSAIRCYRDCNDFQCPLSRLIEKRMHILLYNWELHRFAELLKTDMSVIYSLTYAADNALINEEIKKIRAIMLYNLGLAAN